jgi:hypothetical protein
MAFKELQLLNRTKFNLKSQFGINESKVSESIADPNIKTFQGDQLQMCLFSLVDN